MHFPLVHRILPYPAFLRERVDDMVKKFLCDRKRAHLTPPSGPQQPRSGWYLIGGVEGGAPALGGFYSSPAFSGS